MGIAAEEKDTVQAGSSGKMAMPATHVIVHVPEVVQQKRSIARSARAPLNDRRLGIPRPGQHLSAVTTTFSLLRLIACLHQLVFHLLEGSADIHLVVKLRTRGPFLPLAMIDQIVSKAGPCTTDYIACPLPLPTAHLLVVMRPTAGGTFVLLRCLLTCE
jgi:hypothetical protein